MSIKSVGKVQQVTLISLHLKLSKCQLQSVSFCQPGSLGDGKAERAPSDGICVAQVTRVETSVLLANERADAT